MPKLRKQRRKKVFNHNRNRKRMRNKQFSEGNINCKEIKSAWDSKKSLRANLKEMALCYDPNVTLNTKVTRKEKIAKSKMITESSNDDWDVEDITSEPKPTPETVQEPKKHVLEALIEDATAPRAKMFRLPKGQIDFLTQMLTKHGLDFKAMAKDKKNYNQETWKQLRSKVKRFQSIPEQYEAFLANTSAATKKKLKDDVQMDED